MKSMKCKHCGAPLELKLGEVIQCEYCGNFYHNDDYDFEDEDIEYVDANGNYITLNIYGVEKTFYIGSMEMRTFMPEYSFEPVSKMKIELIET